MRRLISLALRLRVAVVALMAAFAIFAARVVSKAPFDVFPEFAPPLVEIQTEAPGLSTEEVERLITVPLEFGLNGTPFVQTIRSKTVLGLSSVVLIFEPGTDLLRARQLVQERLARVALTLPAVAHPPVLLSPLSSTSRVLKIGLSSPTLSQTELTTLARWTIRPRLIAFPGVANVAIWGQRDKQYQVLVSPERLRVHQVTLEDVVNAAGEATGLGAGGYVDLPNQRLPVALPPTAAGLAQLAAAPIAFRNGVPLPLGAVARLAEGNPPPIGDAVINDGPGLLLIVEKQPWGNTLSITRGVEAALASLKPALGNVTVDATIFRPATYIEHSLSNLNKALLIGCVLVVITIIGFVRDWRTALISLTAIPLSLLAGALVMRYRGGTLDTMVLAGLVIALGEVVDDAIIDVENILRRLRLNRQLPNPRPALQVVLDASLEVRSSVVYASIIVILVFLPVFFLGGLAGAFFRPLALAYVSAIAASLAVALTLTPALSLLLLGRTTDATHQTPLARWLADRYTRLLPPLLERPRRVMGTLGVTLLAALLVVPLLGEEFLPRFREYDFLMHFVEKPGTSLEAMTRVTVRASKELRAIPGVRNFGAHIGRAEVADEVVGPNFTELWISVDPKVNYDRTVTRIQQVVDGYPGLYRDVLTYLRERVKEVLTGASASLVVRLYGPDLDTLRGKGAEVAGLMEKIPGLVDVKVQPQVLVPHLEVLTRDAVAAQLGLTAGAVRRQVAILVKGNTVGQVYEGEKAFDVVVWGEPAIRDNPEAIRQLPITLPSGGTVPLEEVAEVRITPTLNEVTREHASRKLDITANVRGRDLGSAARELEAGVGRLSVPTGYHPEFLGEYAAQRAARGEMLALGALALAGILIILYSDFGTLRLTGLIALTVPFALVGGIVAVLLGGGVLSLGALVGLVTVLGIAARNGIMLVSHYRHLEQEEGVPFGPELVVRGARERLTPILMTALVTALALVPLALLGDRPGHEIEHPMAQVILGGLVSSTALNLICLPVLYLRFGRKR
ncbi:MAG: efflux RND transporter permease subunit [Gemmatimonadales bacterium]